MQFVQLTSIDIPDGLIGTVICTNNHVWVSTTNSKLYLFDVHKIDVVTKLVKTINVEKPITKMILDETKKLLFCSTDTPREITILNAQDLTWAEDYCDDLESFYKFKLGKIDLNSELVTWNLDTVHHRICFQTKERTVLIYDYSNTRMVVHFQQIFKRKCTMLFLIGDFLTCHFEGKVKMHLFKLIDRSLIRIKLYNSSGNIWPDVKYHLPQMILCKEDSEGALALLKYGKKTVPVVLKDHFGTTMPYQGEANGVKLNNIRMTYRSSAPIATSFPWVAAITTKPTLQIEFRSLFGSPVPNPIKEIKEVIGITSSTEKFFAWTSNRLIPILPPNFKLVRETLFLENLESHVDILEEYQNKVDFDWIGKKVDQIKANFKYGKFYSAFEALWTIKNIKRVDIRGILAKYQRFDDLTLTQTPLLPIEWMIKTTTTIPLIANELVAKEKVIHLYKAENALIEFLNKVRNPNESSLDQQSIDYTLLFLYMQRVRYDLTIHDKICSILKQNQCVVPPQENGDLFVNLFKKVSPRYLALLYGYKGQFAESFQILFEILISFTNREDCLNDFEEILSLCEDGTLVEKYTKILLSEDPQKGMAVICKKRSSLSFWPKQVCKWFNKYPQEILYYGYYLVEFEGNNRFFYPYRKYIFGQIQPNGDLDRKLQDSLLMHVSNMNLDQQVIAEFEPHLKTLFYEYTIILRRFGKYKECLRILKEHNGYIFIEELLHEIQANAPELIPSMVFELLSSEMDELFEIAVFFIKSRNLNVLELSAKTSSNEALPLLDKFITKFGNVVPSQMDIVCEVCKTQKSRYKCIQCNEYLCDSCFLIQKASHFEKSHYFVFSKHEMYKAIKLEKLEEESTLLQRKQLADKRKKARIRVDVGKASPISLGVSNEKSVSPPQDSPQMRITKSDYIPIQHISLKNAPLNREYTNHKINFLSVLTEPEMKHGFMSYLESEHNTYPLEFLLSVHAMRPETSSTTISMFFSICTTFILDKSEKAINISGPVRNNISKVYFGNQKEWTETLTPWQVLEPAKNIIVSDLKFDSFPRFIYSDLGFEIISKNVENTRIVSASPLFAIMYKLGESFSEESQDSLKEFAQDLSDSTCLRFKYLSTHWTETMKQEFKVRSSFVSRDTLDNNLETNRFHLSNVKIKIILLENTDGFSKFKKECAKFLSPIMSNLNGFNSTEGCYAALLIGPWLFAWTENSICVPKKCTNTNALLSADINSIYTIKNLEETLDPLAKLITHWNVTKTYRHNFPMQESEKYGNSQHFVEAILNELGVKLQVGPYLDDFLKTIREKGYSEMYFAPCKEMRKEFDLKERYTFANHVSLDEFVRKLMFQDSNFANNWSQEWEFLKSLDRAFWMRHLDEKTESNRPLMNGEIMSCPFNNPLLTHSFIL